MLIQVHRAVLPAIIGFVHAHARPVGTGSLQIRAPQAGDPPGFVPEVTSIIASLAGEGFEGLLDAIYGDKSASSAFAAATSAVGAGDQGAAASYFSEATAAIGGGWSEATDAINGAWTSFTSAYDANGGGLGGDGQTWTSQGKWNGNSLDNVDTWTPPTSTTLLLRTTTSQQPPRTTVVPTRSTTGTASRLPNHIGRATTVAVVIGLFVQLAT